MSDVTIKPENHSFWASFLKIKSVLVVLSLVGLLATNVMTLANAATHDFLHSLLWRALSIGGEVFADQALRKSTKFQLEDKVKSKTRELHAQNLELKEKQKKLVQQIDANAKATKATASKVYGRLKAGVTRNIAALPSEVVPYLGVSVALGVVALDVYDACQTMNDVNGLLRRMGQGEENADLCGFKLPSKDQVIASVKTEWRNSMQSVTDEAKKAGVAMTEVRMPTRQDIGKVICPVSSIPMLCSEN